MNSNGRFRRRLLENCSQPKMDDRHQKGKKIFHSLIKVEHKAALALFPQSQYIPHKGEMLTCSLTEARMDEVVSDSDRSPLEAGSTGGTMAPCSCSAGWSGTGIAKTKQRKTDIQTFKMSTCYGTKTKLQPFVCLLRSTSCGGHLQSG